MKENTKIYFNKAIAILNKLGIKNEDIIVTGSVALDIFGVLPDNHHIHDFDCIVNVNKDNIGTFNLVCEIFKSDCSKEYIGNDYKLVQIGDVLLNIWVNIPHNRPTVTYNGVGVKDMMEILAEKKKYNRDKDIRDINQIIKKILN